MRELRLAIVGMGKMGMLHWRTWQAIAGVKLVAGIDTDARKVMHHSEGSGRPAFHRCEDLIGHIDAAVIATPADQHLRCALPLLRCGIHCLIEKPIALDHADGVQLVAAARTHHACLAVGHSERFNPVIANAYKLIEGVSDIEVLRLATPGQGTPVDVVLDLMVHDLDWLMHALQQAPETIHVLAARRGGCSLAYVSCELGFPGGRRVRLTASRTAKARCRELLLHHRIDGVQRIDLDGASMHPGQDPLTRQAHAFLNFLCGKDSHIASGNEALSAMELGRRIRSACADSEVDNRLAEIAG